MISGAAAPPPRTRASGGWDAVLVLVLVLALAGGAAAVEELADVVCETVGEGRAGAVAGRRGFDVQHSL